MSAIHSSRPCDVSKILVCVLTWCCGFGFGDAVGRVEVDAGRDTGCILERMEGGGKNDEAAGHFAGVVVVDYPNKECGISFTNDLGYGATFRAAFRCASYIFGRPNIIESSRHPHFNNDVFQCTSMMVRQPNPHLITLISSFRLYIVIAQSRFAYI